MKKTDKYSAPTEAVEASTNKLAKELGPVSRFVAPIVPSGPHFVQWQGGNVSKCVRCGTHITLHQNTGMLPGTCTPTPQ